MRCPICKKPLDSTAMATWLPFCSERCKLIDLGRWLSGKYTIPVEPEAAAADNAPDEPGENRPSPNDAD